MKLNGLLKKMVTVLCLSVLVVVVIVSFANFADGSQKVRTKVVIDADPGADDAMALLMMLSKDSAADVVTVTCVKGNTGVQNASRNALLVLQVANRTDIPVYTGSQQGLVYEEPTDNFFGYDGFGDVFKKPPLELVKKGHAALAIANKVINNPGKISILCLGPLTNIAIAIHIYPRLLLDVKEMVILGGSYKGGGNRKPGAEFNFVNDADAAAFVFSKVPQNKLVTLLPLETVDANSFSLSWREDVLGAMGSDFMNFLNKVEKISLDKQVKWRPFDPMAAAILLDPDIITNYTDCKIFVETCGEHGRGAVFVDNKSNTSNVRIVTDVNKELFETMLLTLLS